MRENGIDVSGNQAKHLDTFAGQRFSYVSSLCDRVREACPEFPGHPEMLHWSIPDPAAGPGGDEQTYPAFRRVAAGRGSGSDSCSRASATQPTRWPAGEPG